MDEIVEHPIGSKETDPAFDQESEIIPIDPEGKYLLLARFPETEDRKTAMAALAKLTAQIRRWLKSSEPVLVLGVLGKADIRLAKVDYHVGPVRMKTMID